MEAEICDLDELTGSSSGRPASDSSSSPSSPSLPLSLSPSLSLCCSFLLGSVGQPRSRGFVLTVQSFDRPLTSRDQVYNDLRMREGERGGTGEGRAKERGTRQNESRVGGSGTLRERLRSCSFAIIIPWKFPRNCSFISKFRLGCSIRSGFLRFQSITPRRVYFDGTFVT